jgi:signal transduction histidine kinase/CheY-like chemotaxis protein
VERSSAELTLEYFYTRTYSSQFAARIGSMLFVAAVSTWFHIIFIAAAVVWLIAYGASELIIRRWWRHVSVTLGTLSDAAAYRRHNELIVFCWLTTTIAAAPFVLNTDPGATGAIVSVIFSAGIVMIIAAQHSMTDRMFLWTAPVPALALIVNMTHLAQGVDSWVMGALAVCYVVNARQLQSANTAAELDMVRAQVEADRANKAKSVFLATISHEIRTPLNGVLGMVQVMRFDELSPAQQQRLDVVQRSGEALLALLNDVIDMSKIEAGRIELEQIDFDLGAVIRSGYDAFLSIAADKGVALAMEIEPCCALFHGDPTRIRQIVYNLLSNAVKFTEQGRIEFSAERTEGGIRLVVRDTGIGMSMEAANRIFEKFSQADASTTRRFGGSGLGLSICRELTTLMGGTIAVDSTPGQGSAFTVELPLPFVGPVPAPSAAPVVADIRAGQAGNLRILVAEDNKINQRVLRGFLAVAGKRDLDMVSDGAQAIDAWERQEWDLIFMDVNMPVMDGVAATRQIRAKERLTNRRRTRIIALSANVMSHQIDEYIAAGMDGHLAKPIETAALFAALAQAETESAAVSQDATT